MTNGLLITLIVILSLHLILNTLIFLELFFSFFSNRRHKDIADRIQKITNEEVLVCPDCNSNKKILLISLNRKLWHCDTCKKYFKDNT